MKLLAVRTRSGIVYPIALLAAGVGCITPKPQLAPPAGIYQCPVTVTITDRRSDAKIFYTTDGSAATVSSPAYTAPFAVAGSQSVQSVAKAGGAKTSGAEKVIYACGLTRGEFAKQLAQQFQLPPPVHELKFTDVPRSDALYGSVQAVGTFMNPQVMCPGCQLTTSFFPSWAVTRGISTITLVRILVANNRIHLLTPAESGRILANVSDAKELPSPAQPYFATAIANGILTLQAGNAVQSEAPHSREEMNALLDSIRKRFDLPGNRGAEAGVAAPNH